MLKHRNLIPLDYSLCCMTVTVYAADGTRRVLEGVHYELTRGRQTTTGKAAAEGDFLLVIPGADPIAPGDRVVLGIGPEDIPWEALHPVAFENLGVVRTVKPRYFRGSLCHTEARG